MESPGGVPGGTPGDVLGTFDERDGPGAPLTAAEVADALECTDRGARRRLERLEARGELHGKRLPGGRRVWWRPGSADGREEPVATERDQVAAFVDAVDEYAIFTIDPDGAVASWNEGAERITGYGEGEVLGEHVSIFYAEGDVDRGVPTRNLETAAERGHVEDQGWRIRKDGSEFWADVLVTAVRDGGGSLRGFVKITRDLTEKRRAEEAIERERRRYRTLVEQFPNGAVTLFRDGPEGIRYTIAGGESLERIGVAADDLEGSPVGEALPPPLAERLVPAYRAVLDGDSRLFELEYGGRIYRFRVVPVRDERGEIDAGMAISRDVTERVERERELRRYETLIEESTDVNAILDESGTIRYVTPSTERVLGYAPAEMIGDSAFGYVHPDDRAETRDVFAALIRGDEERLPFEFRVEHDDGSWVWLEARGRDLQDDPMIDGVVAYTREITDRKRYERKLEESNERLEQFASAASHDLREPLRMVSSHLRLLEDRYGGQLEEDATELLEYAVGGADRLRDMIDDLLAYSRVDTRGAPFEPTDCTAVVERVLADLELQIAESDAEIEVGPLPTVAADRNQLGQVFQNLVSNAIKYRGDDPPRIGIEAERDAGEWVFRIEDNGIGIDPAHADRIFEVFARLHTAEEYPGTGIGLALCEKIVERHGGDIRVESDPGAGSTFSFTIPDATDARERGPRSGGATSEASTTGHRTGAPVEVLLVEDTPGDVRRTREAFAAGVVDAELSVVTDGEAALEFLRRGESARRPDLVLLDLNLPGIDGIEVLERMADRPDLKRVPVIVLTGSTAEEDVARSYERCANAYLAKPIDPDEFVALVRTIERFWFEAAWLPPVPE